MSSGVTLDRSVPGFATLRFTGANTPANQNPQYYPDDCSVPHDTFRQDAAQQGWGYFDPSRYANGDESSLHFGYIYVGYYGYPYYQLNRLDNCIPLDKFGDKMLDIELEDGLIKKIRTYSSGSDVSFKRSYSQSELENQLGTSQGAINLTPPKIKITDNIIGVDGGASGTITIWVVCGASNYNDIIHCASGNEKYNEFNGIDEFTCCLPIVFELENGLVKSFSADIKYEMANPDTDVAGVLATTINDGKLTVKPIGLTTSEIIIPLLYGMSDYGRYNFDGRKWRPQKVSSYVDRPIIYYRELHLKFTDGLIDLFEFVDPPNNQSLIIDRYDGYSGNVIDRCAYQFNGSNNESFGLGVNNEGYQEAKVYYPSGVDAINDSWTPST